MNRACAALQLGKTEEALERLERIKSSEGLPDLTRLEGSRCFRRVQAEPGYRELIDYLRDRQRTLRERLPLTLLEHAVARGGTR